MPEAMICPTCGNENRPGARFCDSCGSSLEANAPEPAGGERDVTAEDTGGGRVAGRYALGEFLGHGGRKQVFLATDERDGRQVAVALFNTEGVEEAALARARREMQAMERLGEHPHVVPVWDTGEEDGRPFIVSPYLPGGDVQRLLASSEGGRLPVEQAVSIGIDLCRALEHTHGCGIVHRDLKPANVWLGEDGAARLGDFGLATTGGARGSGVLVGTVAYLPPEQALGRPAGPRSDLYSLGALLYEMVAGRPPYMGDDAVAIIGQHLNAEPVAASRHNPAVPASLDVLLADLLAKRAEDRPESAAAVRERLEQIRDAPPEEAAEPAENPLEALAGGVFVGREGELDELRGAADEALAGRGRLILLSGEPGIGKTRTSEELATYARLRGAKVHWGRCHEGEGAPSYWPWVQVIRSYVREADPVALAWEMGAGGPEIARIVPELAERTGGAAEGGEEEQARFRLFDAIATFLRNASSSRPIVVVLDDLHWADEPSLLLLQFLARELGDSSLLVIGTYRDVELGRHHPLSRVLGELAGTERVSRVALHGLGADDVARYVEITAGARPQPGLIETIHEQTEGNPFFLGEVVRLLASEGGLESGAAVRAAIPQGVRDVVGRRLDQLSAEANAALGTAAAIGRDFDAEILAAVEEAPRAGVDAALEEAVAAQLVSERSGGRYRFSHALVRETLYEELSAAHRPAIHSRIASALEASYSGDPDRLERRLAELAHHFNEAGQAGDLDKAVDYATRAGDRAIAQLGYEEACEHYERALEALELCSDDPLRHCDLLVRLGEAQVRGGHFPEGRATLERAAAEAQALPEGDHREAAGLLARAALGVAYTTVVGAFDEQVAGLLEAALTAIEPGDSPLRARLTSWLGQEHYWRDPQGRSRELHAEAIEMARRIGDDATLAHVLSRANFIDIGPEAAAAGVESNTEVMELARRAGDRELELRSYALRLRDHLALGDIPAVDRDLEAYAALADELAQPQHLWHVPLLRGMRAMIDGRLEEAEELAREAAAGGDRAGEPLSRQFFAIQASVIYRAQGRLEEIAAAVDELADRYPAISAWRVARAAIYGQMGRMDIARTEFERLARDDFQAIPLDAQWSVAHALLCEVAFFLGDGERAESLHRLLAPYAGSVVVAGRAAASWGPVDRYLGLASATAGRLAAAAGELEAALEVTQRMGDRPFGAITRLNLAEVLLRRDAGGDRHRALELVDECLDGSQEMGMRDLTQRALSTKLEAQGLAGVDITTSIDEVISAVESERPDIRAHAAPDGTVTILFSDIEDSTVMTERLGDERWLEVLRSHNSIFRRALRAYDGYEVKNQGDGFMLVFPSPVAAVRCAIEVQRAFEAQASERPEERVRVRMGLHTGEAIAEDGDFFGRNVILAARIAARAGGGEILVSEALREQAESDGDGVRFDRGRELELKGMAGTHTVFRAEWEAEAAAA